MRKKNWPGAAERGSELEWTAAHSSKLSPNNKLRPSSTNFVSIYTRGGLGKEKAFKREKESEGLYNYAMIMTEMVFLYPPSRSIR
jgi:hypothetical protein